MDLKILAICDVEALYAKRLMEVFCEKKTHGFQIHVFSNVAELAIFAHKNELEILLIAGSLMSEEIQRMNIGKIILLTDGEVYEDFSDLTFKIESYLNDEKAYNTIVEKCYQIAKKSHNSKDCVRYMLKTVG